MAEETAEVLDKDSKPLPTPRPLFVNRCRVRACCKPGMFLLIGTTVPYVLDFPLKLVWRSYSRLLLDQPETFVWFDRLFQLVALVGVLSFLISLRVVLRPRRAEEAKWDWNRVAAALALVVFTGSAFFDPARTVYYLFSRSLTEPPRLTEPGMASRLYEVHQRFRRFPADDPSKFYPALSRLDRQFHILYPKDHVLIEREITTPELPLRIAFQGSFYYYLGYRVRDDQEVASYAQAYRKALSDPDPTEFLSLESAGLARLGAYQIPSSIAELPLPDDAWSGIPLLIEAIDPETDTEGYVLFCDGHTERITYPGQWPMTEATITQLQALVDESLRATGEK